MSGDRFFRRKDRGHAEPRRRERKGTGKGIAFA
jgi:hypothetical protein